MIFDKDRFIWINLLGKELDCDVYRLKIISIYKHWAYGVNNFSDPVVISLDMEAEIGNIF